MDTINRINYEKKGINYTQISNNIINDTRLSFKAKGLALAFLQHKNGFIVYKNMLQKISQDGEKSINSGIKELLNCGYLTTIPATTEIRSLSRIPHLEDILIFHEDPVITAITTKNQILQKEDFSMLKSPKGSIQILQKEDFKDCETQVLNTAKRRTNNNNTKTSQEQHKQDCLSVCEPSGLEEKDKYYITLFNKIDELTPNCKELIKKQLDNFDNKYTYSNYNNTFDSRQDTINYILKQDITNEFKVNKICSHLKNYVDIITEEKKIENEQQKHEEQDHIKMIEQMQSIQKATIKKEKSQTIEMQTDNYDILD